MLLSFAFVAGSCAFDLPPPLEADGCPGEPVPCGTACIALDEACEPRDASGTYTVQLRAGADGCTLGNWGEGSTTMVSATVTQEGEAIGVEITGIAGLVVALGIGGDPVFFGAIEGDQIDASLRGTRQTVVDNCAWLIRADLSGVVQEDTLIGTIEYRTLTNEHPDCAPFLADCASIQTFSAARPPR